MNAQKAAAEEAVKQKAIRVMRLRAGGAGKLDGGAGGRGWGIMRRTAKEEVESGSNWKEWQGPAEEEEYDGLDGVKIKNVHGVTTTLEGGWDGRELWRGGAMDQTQMAAAMKWKEQAIAKTKGTQINSLTGEEIGATRAEKAPGPNSPAIIANKFARKAKQERAKARGEAKQQAYLDAWGGNPPTSDEMLAEAEIKKQKKNRKTERGKGVKGTGAPGLGMFMTEQQMETTSGPTDPSDGEGGSIPLGWLEKGEAFEIVQVGFSLFFCDF